MNSLMVNNLGCVTADWNGLKIWEEKLRELKSVYSMFELTGWLIDGPCRL